LGPTLFAALADGLRDLYALTSLDLSRCGARDSGALALAPVARRLPALETLDLSENGLGDAAARALSGDWPSLMALVLKGNAIAHAPPTPKSPYFETLDLERNGLGAARSPGVAALAAYVKSHETLRILKLDGNALRVRNVERLLACGLDAPELRTLDLRGATATPALLRSVAHRTRFTRLDVLLSALPTNAKKSDAEGDAVIEPAGLLERLAAAPTKPKLPPAAAEDPPPPQKKKKPVKPLKKGFLNTPETPAAKAAKAASTAGPNLDDLPPLEAAPPAPGPEAGPLTMYENTSAYLAVLAVAFAASVAYLSS
jgi:hypothetical protein